VPGSRQHDALQRRSGQQSWLIGTPVIDLDQTRNGTLHHDRRSARGELGNKLVVQ